jgi:RNA polymerase sigma factor (sigma-70 family)
MRARWDALLDVLVRERYARLVAHAALVAGSRSAAHDLVQESLVATFTSRARFETVDQAEAYVRRAIASRAIDEGRRRSREAKAVARFVALPAVAKEPAGGAGADVLAALAQLSPRERACVVLRQMEDLSIAQTAATLGLSEGSVKRYTSDGLARLATLLAAAPAATERATVVRISAKAVRGER